MIKHTHKYFYVSKAKDSQGRNIGCKLTKAKFEETFKELGGNYRVDPILQSHTDKKNVCEYTIEIKSEKFTLFITDTIKVKK